MAVTGCEPAAGFAVLRDQSQNENRKLREPAAVIVGQQQRPGAAPTRA